MPQKRICGGTHWRHDYFLTEAGREKCRRCHRLNPLGVPAYIRFWDHVEIGDGCWTWTGAKSRDGYGLFTVVGSGPFRRTVQAHKYAWMMLRGVAPQDGQEFDHTCHNRACINPDHLRVVSHIINMNSRKRSNKCNRGHLIYEPNISMRTGVRRCLLCSLAVVS